MVQVEVVPTSELGDRSYVAHDGQSAVVVDPQRDFVRITELLERLDLRCSAVLETHLHNDYVTGGYALAQATGAEYVVAASDDVAFERRGVRDGDVLQVGSLTVHVVATPGHTEGHVAYVVSGDSPGSVVFTGGSLLYGSVGRTDLVDPARVDELSRAQYRSVRRLADQLDDATPVYPTHGFGSFCSSGSSAGGDDSTIGAERGRNDALVTESEDDFVQKLIAGLTTYPSYYAHMAPLNREGPGPFLLSPPTALDVDELVQRVERGEWVVDLRSRTAFAARHLEGTVSIEFGDNFSTYFGWLLPWGAPVNFVGESADQVAAAQLQLARIGVDAVGGACTSLEDGDASRPFRHFDRATFADLAAQPDATILDVRRGDEVAHGAIEGSVRIPLNSLLERLDEVPDGRLWVHCASGFRASIAASLLDRSGRDVVLVDDDFSNAQRVVVPPPPAPTN